MAVHQLPFRGFCFRGPALQVSMPQSWMGCRWQETGHPHPCKPLHIHASLLGLLVQVHTQHINTLATMQHRHAQTRSCTQASTSIASPGHAYAWCYLLHRSALTLWQTASGQQITKPRLAVLTRVDSVLQHTMPFKACMAPPCHVLNVMCFWPNAPSVVHASHAIMPCPSSHHALPLMPHALQRAAPAVHMHIVLLHILCQLTKHSQRILAGVQYSVHMHACMLLGRVLLLHKYMERPRVRYIVYAVRGFWCLSAALLAMTVGRGILQRLLACCKGIL